MSVPSHETVHDVTASWKTIDDAPIDGQSILHHNMTFTTIKEGLAHILVPEGAKTSLDPKVKNGDDRNAQSVFYNPIQQFNRDLSVLAIRAYGDDLMHVREQSAVSKASRGTKRKRKGTKATGGDSQQAVRTGTPTGGGISPKQRESNVGIELQQGPCQPPMDTMEAVDQHHADATGIEQLQVEPHTDETTRAKEDGSETAQHPTIPRHRGRFKILDALSATGLRALRYAHEIPYVTSVTANDLSKEATKSIETNVKYNKLEDKIQVMTGNAMSHMYSLLSSPVEWSKPPKYDVIDLDPYGTAVPFIDGAVQAINDGGLLCVTCTDAALWASCGYPEKTFSLYGGTPVKGLHSHEGGLRLILHAIASAAGRYGMSIEPLLSLSIDFYARVFVRVFQSPAEVKLLAGKTMLLYNCDGGCGAWSTQLLVRNQELSANNGQAVYKHSLAQGPTASSFCEHCGSKTHISGPMYGGPLHNAAFVQSILTQLPTLDKSTYQTVDRLEGMLTTALEETLLDESSDASIKDKPASNKQDRPAPRTNSAQIDRNPFYFVPSALAKILHARAPSEAEVRGALKHAGYAVTRSHARPGTIKTNAPWTFIWHMFREWVRQKAPTKEGAIKPGTPGYGIMHGAQARQRRRDEDRADGFSHGGNLNGHTASSSDKGEYEDASAYNKTINFDESLGKEPNKRRLKRYQENPRANWGPMNRAKAPAKAAPAQQTAA